MSAPQLDTSAAALAHMRVRGMDDDGIVVADATALVRARRAKGCVVDPETGDLVLVSRGGDGSAWVLAVLEGAGPSRLTLPGDATLQAEGDLSVGAGHKLLLAAPELVAEAATATLRSDRVGVVARLADLVADATKLTGERLHVLVADHLAELGRSIRRVAGLDHTAAGIIDSRAEDTASLHGRYATLTAEKDVRIDGDQIHMG
jgi:hypothetical protein